MTTRGKRNRKRLTLLELLLCIAVLALVSSLTATKASTMIASYRFRREASRLEAELLQSRELAVTAGIDIEFTVKKDKNRLFCDITTDDFVCAGVQRTRRVILREVRRVFLNDREVREGRILFDRSGEIDPQGAMTLHGARQTATVVLPEPYLRRMPGV